MYKFKEVALLVYYVVAKQKFPTLPCSPSKHNIPLQDFTLAINTVLSLSVSPPPLSLSLSVSLSLFFENHEPPPLGLGFLILNDLSFSCLKNPCSLSLSLSLSLMARQENLNLFALLGDGAEDSDDVPMLIESVVKVDPRVAAEEKRSKKKKNMEAEKPIGINLDVDSNNYKNNNIVVDMRAKRIVLPEHGDCFFLILFFLFVSGFFFCVFFLCVCVCVFGYREIERK